MAKVKFGAIITDSRGAIGGQQLRMSHYGNVLTTKANPTKKMTVATTNARAIFTTYSKRWWDVLDSTQRDEWRTLAEANPITNAWGDEYPLTGLAYYIKLNARLIHAGESPTDNAPSDQVVTPLATMTLTATAPDALVITFTATPVPANNPLYVFATGALSPGVANFDGKFYFIGTVAPAETSPFDLGPQYILRLQNLYAGRQYAVSIAVLNTDNGAMSPPLLAKAIAT